MSKSVELQDIDQLILKGQFNEALIRLENLEKKGGLATVDQLRVFLLKGRIFDRQGHYEEALKLAKQALGESQRLNKHLYVVDALIVQEEALWKLGRLDESFKAIELGLQVLATIKTDQSIEIIPREAYLLRHKGNIYYLKGFVSQGMEYHFQSLKLYEKINDKEEISGTLQNIARITALKGDLNLALEYIQQSLVLAEEVDNKHDLAYILGNTGYIHYLKGNLDQSIEYTHRSLSCLEEMGCKQDYAYFICIAHLISVYTDKGDLDQAYHYLRRFKQQISEHETNKIFEQMCKLAEAVILKTSPRMTEKVKALEMLQQLVKDEMVFLDVTITAMLNLCELLIAELKFYGEKEVLTQIRSLLTQIHDIALSQQLSPLMVESLILRAKFSLVDGDAQGADQLLEQAKLNAEERGLDLFQVRITNEQENLQNDLKKWIRLTERNTPLKERLEYAQFEDYLKEAQKTVHLTGRSSL